MSEFVRAVVAQLLYAAMFALDYWIARHFAHANPAWATGYGLAMLIGLVRASQWGVGR